jgi:hypothetical protein
MKEKHDQAGSDSPISGGNLAALPSVWAVITVA